MSSAKLYISSDVVDRLTRPIASSGSVEDSSQQQQQRFDSTSPSGRSSRPGVMNIQSFLGSLQGSAIKASAPSSGSGAQQSPQMSSDEKLKRQLKFESFLNRQKAIMKRKEEQIQQVQYVLSVGVCTWRRSSRVNYLYAISAPIYLLSPPVSETDQLTD